MSFKENKNPNHKKPKMFHATFTVALVFDPLSLKSCF